MDWEKVKDDLYYSMRKLAAEARRTNDGQGWFEFATIKATKGSYLLGVYGYLKAADGWEEAQQLPKADIAYDRAFSLCKQHNYKELALVVAYLWAEFCEKNNKVAKAISVYEQLGRFYEGDKAWFQAADAYEHAAELIARSGGDIAGYTKPIELWQQNAKYWREQGDEGDARWSEEHIKHYKQLFGLED